MKPVLSNLRLNGHKLDAESLKNLAEALEFQEKLGYPKTWERVRGFYEDCECCGERINLERKGKALRAKGRCPYPNGIPDCKAQLNVPSGKMVATDNLKEFFPVTGDYDIRSPAGLIATTGLYEKAGMFHAFVGNTCPGIYETGQDEFVVATKKQGKAVGGICTDLWWVSIADFDAFTAAGGTIDKNISVIPCTPGVYEFTHQIKYDENNPVFTKFKRVGPPKKVKDFRKAWMEQDHTLEEVLEVFEKSWSGYLDATTSTKEGRTQRMLDHIFFTLGNGIDWHPNGWTSPGPMPRRKKGAEAPPPLRPLKKAYSWYPTGDYSFVAKFAGFGDPSYPKEVSKLNPSFRRGLVLCLQNIAEKGCEARKNRNDGPHELRSRQETKSIAEAALAALARHPEATIEEKAFVRKFKLEDADLSYTAARKLKMAVMHYGEKRKVDGKSLQVIGEIKQERNNGSKQHRTLRISTYKDSFHHADHEVWKVRISVNPKTQKPRVWLESPHKLKRSVSLEEAIPILCLAAKTGVQAWSKRTKTP